MNSLLANIHWFILLYAGYNLYTMYEEKTLELENSQNSLSSVEASLAKEKRKLKKIDAFRKNLSDSEARVQDVLNNIEKVQRQLPSDINAAKTANDLNELAQGFKFKNISVSPADEKMEGFYFEKRFNFEADGTYLQSLIYFENIESQDQLYNIKKAQLINETTGKRGRFQVLKVKADIFAYRYNPAYKEKAALEEEKKKQ